MGVEKEKRSCSVDDDRLAPLDALLLLHSSWRLLCHFCDPAARERV